MKKNLFSIIAVAILTAGIFLACTKEDNDGIAVTYTNQAGSTGNSGGTTTTTTGTTTPTTNTVSINGGSATTVSPNNCFTTTGLYTMTGTVGAYSYTIQFLGTPTAGAYPVMTGTPTSGKCSVTFDNGTSSFVGQAGTTVTVGIVSGKVKASFTNLACTDPTPTTVLFTGNVVCL